MPLVDARCPVDDYRPPWRDVEGFLRCRPDAAPFLTELRHDRGTRREWDTAAWRDWVRAIAGSLRERGAGPGTAVAMLAGNHAEALALAYACWWVGACYVPLSPQDTAERQRFILRDARTTLLVYADGHADRAHELVAAPHPADAFPATGSGTAPQGHGFSAPSEGPGAGSGTAPQGHGFSAPSEGPGAGSSTVVPGVDRPAVRLYTSGTTGEPKGVVLSLANLWTDLDGLRQVFGWHAGTRVLTVLPLHHANALVISSLLSWVSGASTVLCDRFRTDRFFSDAAAERATTASLVPTLLEFLLAAGGTPPPGFGEVLCGAGPLSVDTALRFEERFGLPIRHLYGLSETSCVATAMPALEAAERRHWHTAYGFPSVGTALPHADLAVLDPAGAALPAGVRGEIAVRGGLVLREYANRPEATGEALRHGWFHTGDEGFWQPGPGGRPAYFVTGRLKELIIRGGHNISPFEIDEVLQRHPRVRFGLAVPFDHRVYGEEVAAYVVPDGSLTEPEVLSWCADRLDFALQPKVVVFGEDVPFTATGKAKRLELSRRLAPVLAAHRDTAFRRPRSGG